MSSAPTPREKAAVQTFSMRLDGDLSGLAGLEQWVERLKSEANLSNELCFKLNLILEEAATNIIRYGLIDGQSGYVDISICINSYQVLLEIRDNGVPFNPLEDHTVVLPNQLQDADIGGLGIHLMKSYADSMTYQRTKDLNVLKMSLPL